MDLEERTMQKIDNWDKVQAAVGPMDELEPGGYICKIMDAKVATYHGQNGDFDKLEVYIDIDDGDFKGYYADDYRSQAQWGRDQKWKGVLRLYVPTDGDDQQAKRSQSIFKAFTDAVEASNPGYKWEWNEGTLKGKRIGVMFRSEEYDYNGYHGWKTRPFKAVSVDFVKSGKFETPKPKALRNSQSSEPAVSVPNNNSDFNQIPSDDDLPF
jgi:hypothetical protein